MVTGRPLRIGLDAHVIGRRKTGNETYAVGLGRALAARPDVALTAFLQRGAAWPPAASTAAAQAAPTVVQLRTTRRAARLALELPVRARRERLDILHVQYVAPPVAGLPVAVAIHDVSFEDRPDLFSMRSRVRLRTTIRPSAQKAAVILVLSEFTRARLLHHYDLDPSRVVVVPAGVDAAHLPAAPPPAEDARHLARLGVPDRFVLHVGDLIPRKNVPRLVTAMSRVRREGGGDVELVLAGQAGQDSPAVEAAIAAGTRQGTADWVHRLGYVDADTLEALYRRAMVVAQPSLYEGFGLPVLEAMVRGVPVVSSSTTALPEVVGNAGLLVDPEDVGALAHALGTLLGDETERARLSEAGRARARCYTWAAAAERAVGAYRQALGR